MSQPDLSTQEPEVDNLTMSPTRSVPAGLQRSTETLDSHADAGSIGSFR